MSLCSERSDIAIQNLESDNSRQTYMMTLILDLRVLRSDLRSKASHIVPQILCIVNLIDNVTETSALRIRS